MSDINGLSDVRPQRRNANKHSQRGMGQLEQSVQTDGWIGAITVAADGETFDGSARIEVAAATGFDNPLVVETDGTRPVILRRVDIPSADDPRAVRLGIAANRVAEVNLTWNTEVLTELAADGIDLSTFWTKDELALLVDQDIEPGGGGDDFNTEPEDGPTTVQPGQLWQLGEHRLLCGDSTKTEDVARLMDGERAQCMWTDPPYGVSYVGKTKDALTIQNDGAEGLASLLVSAFECASSVLAQGAAFYIARPPGALSVTFGNAILGAGWRLHEELQWVKDSMVLGHSDYHIKHETIMFGYLPGNGRQGRGGGGWYGDNSQVSVFEIPRPKASPDHPTGKPVELIERMLRNSTKRHDVVYEPFGGSGSTLIACERLGRQCRLIEIEPKYCDVILRRFEAETGIAPVLVS